MSRGRGRCFLPPCAGHGRRIACFSNAYCRRTRIDQLMTDRDAAARAEILARLAVSREELKRVLDPARNQPGGGGSTHGDRPGGFPRSRTMQMLLSAPGLGTLGAAAAG